MTAHEERETGLGRSRAVLHGRALTYLDFPGPGTPVLLVHGVGSSADTWGEVPGLIGGSRRVIAVDLPGHGQSETGNGDYSLGSMASILRDLLDDLGIARVHLVGHSLGGGISMQFAYQFPDRVASMTLESSGGLGTEVFAGLRAASLPGSDLVLRLLAGRPVQATAAWLGRAHAIVRGRPHPVSGHALETVAGWSDAGKRAAFLATLRSVVGPEGQRVSALPRLPLVDASRVLLVWGDRDPMIPVDHGHQAHALLPGSRLVVFPGSHHEPHVDDPDRFAALITEHVQACEDAAERTASGRLGDAGHMATSDRLRGTGDRTVS
jgi:pimeloyl-ACP methyl ester carboxylesterase